MAFPAQLLLSSAIKIVIILLTIAVLILLDPTYVTAYISINYEIVLIYMMSALTFLYCIVSIIMYLFIGRSGNTIEERKKKKTFTNCALSEIIFCGAGIMGWLIVIGIGGTISQRTIIETGERFGWLAALAGINVGCFLGIMGIFLIVIVEKIQANRQKRYERSQAFEDQHAPLY